MKPGCVMEAGRRARIEGLEGWEERRAEHPVREEEEVSANTS
jgi:hypothetical protein